MKTKRVLVLVRHAHRDKPAPLGRAADNGLSKKGMAQAKAIAKKYREEFDGKKARLISSPKVRCVETLEPIAKKLKREIQREPALLEQAEGESDSSYHKRIQDFFSKWEKGEEKLTMLCGHGDLFGPALEHLVGCPIDLKKGGWILVENDGKETRLRELAQKC